MKDGMKDTALAIAAVLGLVALFAALLTITGCSGAAFSAYIPPAEDDAGMDAPWYDQGPKPAPEPFTKPFDAGMAVHDAALETAAEASPEASPEAAPDAAVDSWNPADTGPDAPETSCTPVSHVNGMGQSYMDCAALGTPGNQNTYSEAMGQEAAAAWIKSFDSGFPSTNGIDPNCNGGTSTCWAVIMMPQNVGGVWCFTGSLAGHVGSGGCPGWLDPVWN